MYVNLFIIIITLRFTCGERKIGATIKESQNIMNMIIGLYIRHYHLRQKKLTLIVLALLVIFATFQQP